MSILDSAETVGIWEPGKIESVYRGDARNSVSNSERELFRNSPEAYHETYILEVMEGPKGLALEIGSGFHARVLLPDDDSIVTIPPNCLTKSGARNTRSAEYKEFEAANSGKTILKTEELVEIDAMRHSAMQHPIAGGFLRSGGESELPVRVQCPITGLHLRCRFDLLTKSGDGQAVNIDFKTYGGDIRNVDKIASHMDTYGYVRQLAFYRYCHLLAFGDDCQSMLIFIEKKQPYRVQAICPPDEWLQDAHQENIETLEAMKTAIETNVYKTPGIDEVLCPERPRWAKYQAEYAR